LRPGDRVGNPKSNIDYSTSWFLLDVVPALGASDQDLRDGYGSMVLLQSLDDPSQVEWRSPRDDRNSPDRRDLSGKVKLADLSEEQVASSEPAGQRPGAPARSGGSPSRAGQPAGGTN